MNKKIFEINGGGVTSAPGFKAAGITAGLKKSGLPDMAMVYSESPCSFACAFTSCTFAAAPVQLGRETVMKNGKVHAVIINSGNANACTGDEGIKNARAMADTTANTLGISPDEVFVASTGRIGVQLPMDIINAGIARAASALSENAGLKAAEAIMTTDTRKKEVAVSFRIGDSEIVVGGMAKGAGMIAPKMAVPHATMISCITTNASISNNLLSDMLGEIIERSFNRVTVDGDMSTNDSVYVLANSLGPEIIKGSESEELFMEALENVCAYLAKEMARDGEGATKLITVEVLGAKTDEDAKLCAGAVANSLLCKTAWFGGDPNWGRVLAAAGYSGAEFDPGKFSMDYDEMPVVRGGMDAGTPEEKLGEVLKRPEFTVKINLNAGDAACTMWTCDISYEYVKINAEYHT